MNWVSPFLKDIAGLAKRRLLWRAKPWTATSFIATKPPPGRPCCQSSANSLTVQRRPAHPGHPQPIIQFHFCKCLTKMWLTNESLFRGVPFVLKSYQYLRLYAFKMLWNYTFFLGGGWFTIFLQYVFSAVRVQIEKELVRLITLGNLNNFLIHFTFSKPLKNFHPHNFQEYLDNVFLRALPKGTGTGEIDFFTKFS